MKSVLISTRPNWCEKICRKIGEQNGIPVYLKPVEVRKSAPKEVPFRAYLYCTNGRFDITDIDDITSESVRVVSEGRGKVIGEFVCDKVIKTCGWRLRGNTGWCAKRTEAEEKFPTSACLTIDEIVEYAGGEGREVSGWHISDLKIYDKPRELGEFTAPCKQHKTKPDESCKGCPYIFKGMTSGKLTCDRALTRAPQSWQYVEEIEE